MRRLQTGRECPDRHRRRRGAVLNSKLSENLLEVLVYRTWANAENSADVAIRFSFREPYENFGLAGGERHRLLQKLGSVALI